MISPAESLVSKGRRLTGPEAYFCRLVACEGKSATQAYRVAYKCQPKSAPELASRTMDRPHVAARIAELRSQADRQAVMAMNERRRLLADTARNAKGNPTHSDRIAAIREDAILAGERRSDGSQLTLSVDVSATIVVAALRGMVSTSEPRNVTEISAPAGPMVGESSDSGEKSVGETSTLSTLQAVQPSAFGPLGMIEESGPQIPAPPPPLSYVDSE